MCLFYPHAKSQKIDEKELIKTLMQLKISKAKFIASTYSSEKLFELQEHHEVQNRLNYSKHTNQVKVNKEMKKKDHKEKEEEKKRILAAFKEDRNV